MSSKLEHETKLNRNNIDNCRLIQNNDIFLAAVNFFIFLIKHTGQEVSIMFPINLFTKS